MPQLTLQLQYTISFQVSPRNWDNAPIWFLSVLVHAIMNVCPIWTAMVRPNAAPMDVAHSVCNLSC